MTSPDDNMDKLLDAYLDQQLTEADRIEFEKSARDQPELVEQIELQADIDASLQRMFTPPNPPRLKLPPLASLQAEENVRGDSNEEPTLDRANNKNLASNNKNLGSATKSSGGASRRLMLAALATAAAVSWIYIGTQLLWPSRPEVAYRPRPLTEVYQECVDQGFVPYWVCEDETTFANTFGGRQGVKLKLGEMPPSQQMVGLAYLAGLSLDSTSLLASVDGQPVIVFVDRIENDWKPATGDFPDKGLYVTRAEKDGLVMYEVSPIPNSGVLQSLTAVPEPR